MKVTAVNRIWYAGKEWLPGAEFEYHDGADLNPMLALGNVKPVGEEEPKPPPREDYTPWSE